MKMYPIPSQIETISVPEACTLKNHEKRQSLVLKTTHSYSKGGRLKSSLVSCMETSLHLLTSNLNGEVSNIVAKLILSSAGVDSTKKLALTSAKISSMVYKMVVLEISVDCP